MAKIKHIAIWTDDPPKLAKFYCDTFGMTKTLGEVHGGPDEDNFAIFITDGYLEVAIIKPNSDQTKRGLRCTRCWALVSTASSAGHISAKLHRRRARRNVCQTAKRNPVVVTSILLPCVSVNRSSA